VCLDLEVVLLMLTSLVLRFTCTCKVIVMALFFVDPDSSSRQPRDQDVICCNVVIILCVSVSVSNLKEE
jgi:hypothetical protein